MRCHGYPCRVGDAATGRLDDFLFGGASGDAEWQQILKKIKDKFRWGDWEEDTFTQCGVLITQTPEGFELSQKKYVEEHVVEVPLPSSRRKTPKAETTDREKTALRATLGALSWHGQQVAPQISAEVGLLLSEVSKSTVETIIRTNILVQHTRARKDYKILVHRFAPTEELCLYAWVDAGSQNRPDGGSTQGIVIGIGPRGLLRGDLGSITLLSWHSNRIDRTCRSPGAAEALAAVNGEDILYFARFQMAEIEEGCKGARNPNSLVRRIPGCVVTDSRNVYDKMSTEVLSRKGAEKRSNLEMSGLKEAQSSVGVTLRWVHSEAQLANSLTKAGGAKELEMFYKMQYQWRIVEDPEMRSARKRRAEGMQPLAQADASWKM